MMESGYHMNRKSEQKQRGEYEERSGGLQTCEFLIDSILEFVVNHINILKLKDIRVLLCYHFISKNLKGVPNKLNTVESIIRVFRKDC